MNGVILGMYFWPATVCDQLTKKPSYPQNTEFAHYPSHSCETSRQAMFSLVLRFSLVVFTIVIAIFGPLWISAKLGCHFSYFGQDENPSLKAGSFEAGRLLFE